MADERTLGDARALAHDVGLGPVALDRACRGIDLVSRASRGRAFADLGFAAQQRVLASATRLPGVGATVDACHLLFGLAHFDRDDVRRPLPHAEPPPSRGEPNAHAERFVVGAEVDAPIECDVAVVGTGAGGAVVGAELSARGHAVVFIEEGAARPRHELSATALDAHRRLYREPTLAIGNALVPILAGRLVGGSTAVNTGTCFRPPEAVLERWCEALRSDDLAPERLAPQVARVEARLGVAPVAESLVGPVLAHVRRGLGALGHDVELVRRNAEGCEGRGFCDFGCPRGARRSVDAAYLPHALARGSLVLTDASARRVLIEGRRAVGVRVASRGRVFDVRARAVVLAAGALSTPHVLHRSGVGGDALGRHLCVQPSAIVGAMFDAPVRGPGQVPQGWCSRGLASDGVLLVGAQADASVAPLVLALRGQPLAEVLERFEHVAFAGVLVEDRGVGRLVLGSRVARYSLTDETRARLTRGMVHAARAFEAAGASAILPGARTLPRLDGRGAADRLEAAAPKAHDLLLTSFHPLGTCRMGRDRRTSVIDLDHRVHGTDALYVVDGSALPSALGVNPQITIMALATRAAARVDAAL